MNIFKKTIKAAKEYDALISSFREPPSVSSTKPPNVTSGVQSKKTRCTYKTPCGWCTKWDKKCDEKPYKRGLRVNINPVDDACGLKLEKL